MKQTSLRYLLYLEHLVRAVASGGPRGAIAPPHSQQTIFLKRPNLRARLHADSFLSSFSKLKSRNAFLANLGPYILKIFRGSMPPDPSRRPKKSPCRFAARKTFLGQALPPRHKNLATALLVVSSVGLISHSKLILLLLHSRFVLYAIHCFSLDLFFHLLTWFALWFVFSLSLPPPQARNICATTTTTTTQSENQENFKRHPKNQDGVEESQVALGDEAELVLRFSDLFLCRDEYEA